MQDLCNLLESIEKKYHSYPIWIIGDINLPNFNWELNLIGISTYPTSLNKLFMGFLQDYRFT